MRHLRETQATKQPSNQATKTLDNVLVIQQCITSMIWDKHGTLGIPS